MTNNHFDQDWLCAGLYSLQHYVCKQWKCLRMSPREKIMFDKISSYCLLYCQRNSHLTTIPSYMRGRWWIILIRHNFVASSCTKSPVRQKHIPFRAHICEAVSVNSVLVNVAASKSLCRKINVMYSKQWKTHIKSHVPATIAYVHIECVCCWQCEDGLVENGSYYFHRKMRVLLACNAVSVLQPR